MINQINELTDGHKQDYYIYVDESASIWDRFDVFESAARFYPALTGVVGVGLIYIQDGQTYCNNNTSYPGWMYYPDQDEPKMTIEAAIEKCKSDGKVGLIYIYDDTWELIPVR